MNREDLRRLSDEAQKASEEASRRGDTEGSFYARGIRDAYATVAGFLSDGLVEGATFPEREPALLVWEWREQPDLDELARVLLRVTAGLISATEVVETGSDVHALVIGPPMTVDEATEIFDAAEAAL